jgi:hypothetical protein
MIPCLMWSCTTDDSSHPDFRHEFRSRQYPQCNEHVLRCLIVRVCRLSQCKRDERSCGDLEPAAFLHLDKRYSGVPLQFLGNLLLMFHFVERAVRGLQQGFDACPIFGINCESNTHGESGIFPVID